MRTHTFKETGGLTPLLSRQAAKKMGVITVNGNEPHKCKCTYERSACKKHPVKFNDTELRDLPGGSVHLTLATDAKSVIKPPINLPEAILDEAKYELKNW